MSEYNKPAISRPGVQHEKEHALIDARDIIWERGEQITIRLYEEDTIVRDQFNSIVKREAGEVTDRLFYSYPVIYSPTDKDMEKAGIRERTRVIVYTAMQDWIDYEYTLDTLKDLNSIRMSVIINGAKYEIVDKALQSQFADTYLYVVLGLNRV